MPGEGQSFLAIFCCLEKGFCLEEFTTARRAALTQERSSASRRGTGLQFAENIGFQRMQVLIQ
jgi:hypothetical protein